MHLKFYSEVSNKNNHFNEIIVALSRLGVWDDVKNFFLSCVIETRATFQIEQMMNRKSTLSRDP